MVRAEFLIYILVVRAHSRSFGLVALRPDHTQQRQAAGQAQAGGQQAEGRPLTGAALRAWLGGSQSRWGINNRSTLTELRSFAALTPVALDRLCSQPSRQSGSVDFRCFPIRCRRAP